MVGVPSQMQWSGMVLPRGICGETRGCYGAYLARCGCRVISAAGLACANVLRLEWTQHAGGSVRRRMCLAQGEPGEEWWEVNVGRDPEWEQRRFHSLLKDFGLGFNIMRSQ